MTLIRPMAFDLKSHPLNIAQLNKELEEKALTEKLAWVWETFGARAAIGTSFQGAGIVIMDHASAAGIPLPVFTLNTGLLFSETLALQKAVEERFNIVVEGLHPEQSVEEQAAEHGDALWSRKPDLCCVLRKVLPLQKKLESLDVWITGVRRQQASTREGVKILELYRFDVLRDRYILKMNPLAAWTREQVWEYIREKNLPSNPLLDKGFRSIGCVPCTRPVGEGDNERAGRWTGFDKEECGIHTFLGDSI
ncbi:MAG: phosphoadenylyl-sulfate reductase [Verrucomicrobiales bacterium]